jgi:glutaconate CoA-transferase, subunit A
MSSLESAVAKIHDGDTVGIGGFNFQNKAQALVREIVRQEKKDLLLICGAPSSIDADMLIAGGCVREVILQSCSLERFAAVGPGFRRAAQAGTIRVVDCDQGGINAGLRAAKAGLPSQLSLAPLGADFEKVAPDWFKEVRDPFENRRVVMVRAMRPDFAIVHGAIADSAGHAQQLGSVINDRLLCGAAKNVIVSVEQVVPRDVIERAPERTFTWAHNTVAVVEAPFGAHPTSCQGRYPYDAVHLREYAVLARTEEGFDQYRRRYVAKGLSHVDYLASVGVQALATLESRRHLIAGRLA